MGLRLVHVSPKILIKLLIVQIRVILLTLAVFFTLLLIMMLMVLNYGNLIPQRVLLVLLRLM